MPTFQNPKYSKVIHPKSGNAEPCYTFIAEHSESDKKLTMVAEEPITLSTLEQLLQENTDWWNSWIAHFLDASAKHFSKPYTVQHIHKITKHHLNQTEDMIFPANISFYPQTIRIHGGAFLVDWCYQTTPVTIDIPDLPEEEETLPVYTSTVSNDVQEMNLEEVPVDPNATEESLVLRTPTKFYEKNKVKEARLKAKIAMYRAQYQMNKYYEKYGTEVTDSDTDEEASEEDEVQL